MRDLAVCGVLIPNGRYTYPCTNPSVAIRHGGVPLCRVHLGIYEEESARCDRDFLALDKDPALRLLEQVKELRPDLEPSSVWTTQGFHPHRVAVDGPLLLSLLRALRG